MQVGKCDGVLSLSTATGNDQEEGAPSVGCSEQEAGQTAPIPEVDAAYIAAINRVADAIILLAQATAGEIERDDDDSPRETDISGRPI